MALAANAWLGWAFVTWLQEYRRFHVTRSGRLALVLVITAAGSPAYLWSPLTPGYYDLTALITLNLATLMFLNARRIARGAGLGAAHGVAAGMLSVVLLFTKWPAVTVVAVTEGAALLLISPGGKRGASRGGLRHMLGFVAGVLAMTAILQVWVHPVADSLAVLVKVTTARSGGAGGPGALLTWYATDTFSFVVAGALFTLPAAMVVWIGLAVAKRRGSNPTPWFLGAMGLLGVALPLAAGWRGGGSHGRAAFAAVTGALFIACVAGLIGRGMVARGGVHRIRDSRAPARPTSVICCLVMLPVLSGARHQHPAGLRVVRMPGAVGGGPPRAHQRPVRAACPALHGVARHRHGHRCVLRPGRNDDLAHSIQDERLRGQHRLTARRPRPPGFANRGG